MSKSRTSPGRPPARAVGRPTPAAARLPARRGVLVAVSAVAVLAVLVTVALLATRGGDDQSSAAGAAPEIAHVHGLGVDPEDGVLYAGTHYGLLRLPEDGDVARVADREQDFMGFTIAGANHYLASGHPGEGQDGPSSLGLIESTDGGQTWQSLSLAGEADFHSLEARHGKVYGLNSMTGEFMVSDDKTTWDVRSQIPMADFAVSPDNPEVLLATTEQGLVRSTDGGRNYEPVAGAPLLQLVSWADDGTIVGVQPDGTVQASIDDAETWEKRDTLGSSPHAFTATSDSELYAAVEGRILYSNDGGRTFSVRYEK